MKRSISRILTTHTGSLPRPVGLQELLWKRESGGGYDEEGFAIAVRNAVSGVVAKQLDTGIDVVNDGEQGRSQYTTYVKERLRGFDGERVPSSLSGDYLQAAIGGRHRLASAGKFKDDSTLAGRKALPSAGARWTRPTSWAGGR